MDVRVRDRRGTGFRTPASRLSGSADRPGRRLSNRERSSAAGLHASAANGPLITVRKAHSSEGRRRPPGRWFNQCHQGRSRRARGRCGATSRANAPRTRPVRPMGRMRPASVGASSLINWRLRFFRTAGLTHSSVNCTG